MEIETLNFRQASTAIVDTLLGSGLAPVPFVDGSFDTSIVPSATIARSQKRNQFWRHIKLTILLIQAFCALYLPHCTVTLAKSMSI